MKGGNNASSIWNRWRDTVGLVCAQDGIVSGERIEKEESNEQNRSPGSPATPH